jgi:hypothetical protein
MNVSVIEASNYFKGLLLLIGKDKRITEPEATILKRIGKALGFEKEFCEKAIHEILNNKYIVDTPPVFSTEELARKFIQDGLTLAASDNEFHPAEIEWLKSVAKMNRLDMYWFQSAKNAIQTTKALPLRLEAETLIKV